MRGRGATPTWKLQHKLAASHDGGATPLAGDTPTWGQGEGTGAILNSGGDEPTGGIVREGEWGGLGLSQKKAK
ncbi:hypothetical protein NUACC21_74820 [Scytonema sp. NUACC21]